MRAGTRFWALPGGGVGAMDSLRDPGGRVLFPGHPRPPLTVYAVAVCFVPIIPSSGPEHPPHLVSFVCTRGPPGGWG